MLAAGQGVIINIGSTFGEVGMPMRAAYAASKRGLVGLTPVPGEGHASAAACGRSPALPFDPPVSERG